MDFWTFGLGSGRGLVGRLNGLRDSLVGGGWDVLIFFDFMSIPQIGQGEGQVELPRTPEEDEVFQECLPNIGTLYSMFPVLVLDAVMDGVPPYHTSGWCFAELTTAALGKQLIKYSHDHEENAAIGRDTSLGHASATSIFQVAFEAELAQKIFFFNSDRVIVRNIVNDYVSKRRLMEAIDRKDRNAVLSVLLELPNGRRQVMINQPVDETLNTPLHRAVQIGCVEVAQLLINHGADPNWKNVRGDHPAQWFIFPRMRRAAQACRNGVPQSLRLEVPAVIGQAGGESRGVDI